MKRYIYTFLILMISVLCVSAQEMDALFVTMPDQYIPQLQNEWRKDLIDLYNSGKDATLKNTMEGSSTLKKMTSDYMLLQVTDRSTVELKRLPLINNTNVICMIRTVYGPQPDSRIEFFTTDWQPISGEDLFTPVDSEWFLKDGIDRSSISFDEALSLLDMDLWKYSLSPDDQTLTMEYMTPYYLGKTDRSKVAPFLKETPKIYTWEKSHFK